VPVEPLDLASLKQLTFEQPDEDAFPCLRLAREAGKQGGTAPCVLNAANEVAVQAFLDGDLSFNGIADVIAQALEAIPSKPVGHFSDLYRADTAAREQAAELIHGVTA
jgi:1-deoxy-D-xylulose-5-phosphate reductoisomerase